MNNYVNMGGMFPNEFMIAYPEAMPQVNMPVHNNELSKRLSKQAGDNMNFNKCGFDGKTTPNELYDVYNGFIRGNMFPNLFNQYKLSRPYDVKPMNEQAELLTKVDAYAFAVHDINLYLDTHPNDRSMIDLFNQLSADAKAARREYESKYGPLLVNSNEGYPWTWNNMPWPWENN